MIRKFKIDYFEPDLAWVHLPWCGQLLELFYAAIETPSTSWQGFPFEMLMPFLLSTMKKKKESSWFCRFSRRCPTAFRQSILDFCRMSYGEQSKHVPVDYPFVFQLFQIFLVCVFLFSCFLFQNERKKTCIPWHLKLSFAFSYRFIFWGKFFLAIAESIESRRKKNLLEFHSNQARN